MATGAVIARILTQYSDKGSKQAQKDIAKLAKKFDDFGKKARASFALAITATAALSVKIGSDAVQAAIDDAKSQVVLANALKATVGETGKLTAAAEEYIKTTMFRVNVGDELLRASLAQLIIATGDLTQAKRLQTIALDVSAASGRDLAAVTIAITRAQQGNVTSLKRLSPELSGLIKQGMAAESVFALLEGTYGGTAEALADLDPLTKLRLAYGETLETLGTALLPVVKEFAEYIISDVIPAIDEWVAANGDKLQTAIRDIADGIIYFSGVFKDLTKFLSDNRFLITLAINLFAIGRGAKIAGKFMEKLDVVIGKGIKVFKNFGKAASNLKDKFFDLVKTDKDGSFGRFVSLVGTGVEGIAKFIGAMLSLGAVGITVSKAFKSLLGIEEKRVKTTFDLTKQTYGGAAAEKYKAEVAAAAAKKTAAARAAVAAQAAKDAAREAADAAKQKRIDDAVLRVKKQLNITKDSALDKETDLIQLAAAEALLKKQGVIAKEEMAKLERLKEENFLLDAREVLAKRYLDIQKVLADQKLETKEIEELSKKWGISNAAVISYIHLVKSVEDQVISTEEIKTLASLWNTSEYEAQKFLETYMRIQDGLLDSNEVFDLIKKGFFETEKEARIYADIVATVHDGIANDADFQKVADKWDITKEKVNEYLRTMGADFDYEGTFIDPVTLLATQWESAAKALQDYLDKLNSAKSFDYNKLGPSGTPVVPPVVVVPPKTSDGLGGRTDSAAEAASKAAATSYAIAKAKGDMDAAAIAAAGVRPSDLALGESGAIGALSIATQLKAAEAAQAKAQRDALANFKAAEALSAKNDSAASATMDYDERFRFRNSMTMDNSKGLMGSGGNNPSGNTNVVVNVQGNVTTQQDLVQSIRNGLLAGQYNGQTLTLEAI
jgi:hypothetical protein